MNTRLLKQIGPYNIIEKIAESGCSTVYLGSADASDQVLVVKVSHGENRHKDEQKYIGKNVFADLIYREVEVLSSLHHPGIVHIFPIPNGSTNRAEYTAKALNMPNHPLYFTMEYLAGGSLRQHMSRIQKYPLEWRLELFYQILVNVDYMHQMGWAHCDLKPDNIFFRQTPQKDEIPLPVLIDMGTVSDSEILDTEIVVSLQYAAPEALKVIYSNMAIEDVGLIPAMLDVRALGAIFYEMVTGKTLIRDKQTDKIITSIINQTHTSIAQTDSKLPANLDPLLQVMLHQEPDKRPPVSHLIEALEIYVSPPPRVSSQRSRGLFGR